MDYETNKRRLLEYLDGSTPQQRWDFLLGRNRRAAAYHLKVTTDELERLVDSAIAEWCKPGGRKPQ